MSTIIPNDVVRTGGRWVRPRIVHIPPLFGEELYLTRYVLFRTPWFGVYVHQIHAPDGDRDPHNHPRQFWSLVLRGGYVETIKDRDDALQDGRRLHKAGSLHRMRLSMFHGIEGLLRCPTWTLLVVGRQHQDWGFWTDEGFVLAEDYKAFVERGLLPQVLPKEGE